MMTTKRMKKGALGEEGEIHSIFVLYFVENPLWKNFPEKRFHVHIPHPCTERTIGWANFKNFFTVLCLHTFLIV